MLSHGTFPMPPLHSSSTDGVSPADAPTLPPFSPLQACECCEALVDITERDPLEKLACPSCGATIVVKGRIEHYELVDVAGRGGMGVVYKAYDSSLDRYVAVKLLRKDHSSNAELIQQL